MEKNYKLDGSVIARLLQIVQEAMLTGTDIVDHLRLLTLKSQSPETDLLILTPEYEKTMIDYHKKLQDKADELKNTVVPNNSDVQS